MSCFSSECVPLLRNVYKHAPACLYTAPEPQSLQAGIDADSIRRWNPEHNAFESYALNALGQRARGPRKQYSDVWSLREKRAGLVAMPASTLNSTIHSGSSLGSAREHIQLRSATDAHKYKLTYHGHAPARSAYERSLID